MVALTMIALGFGCSLAAEEYRVATRDELAQALKRATPGVTISIAPGEYRGGFSSRSLRGTAKAPIVIAGADADDPPVIQGGGNAFHFSSCEHLELRDLVLEGATGNGLNIDDAAGLGASHIVLRNLVVREVGPEGNRDGIKLSGVDDFQVIGCEVSQWGAGGSAIDAVGCHRGEISGCRFLKARGEAANGVQAKGGSSQIAIRRCRFENAGGRAVNAGGSTGLDYFRPRDAEFEAKEITVEDNEFLGGTCAVAFVGVDGAAVRHNTIYRPGRWVFRILQENTAERFVPCRKGEISKNAIFFRASELREAVNVGGNTAPESFTFAGNCWSCLDRPSDARRLVRLPSEESDNSYDADLKLSDPENGDLRILDRSPDDAGAR